MLASAVVSRWFPLYVLMHVNIYLIFELLKSVGIQKNLQTLAIFGGWGP